MFGVGLHIPSLGRIIFATVFIHLDFSGLKSEVKLARGAIGLRVNIF